MLLNIYQNDILSKYMMTYTARESAKPPQINIKYKYLNVGRSPATPFGSAPCFSVWLTAKNTSLYLFYSSSNEHYISVNVCVWV